MIRFILLQNRAGKTRLAKYYIPLDDTEKHKMNDEVHRLISTRDPKFTNFVEVSHYVSGGAHGSLPTMLCYLQHLCCQVLRRLSRYHPGSELCHRQHSGALQIPAMPQAAFKACQRAGVLLPALQSSISCACAFWTPLRHGPGRCCKAVPALSASAAQHPHQACPCTAVQNQQDHLPAIRRPLLLHVRRRDRQRAGLPGERAPVCGDPGPLLQQRVRAGPGV